MKKFITLFAIAIAFSFAAQAQESALTIPFATAAKTVDGLSDDWSETWIPQAAANANNSTTAMSSKFQIEHDADNIYLIVAVEDASANTDSVAIPNDYERDCIEFFVSMHSVDSIPTLVAGDWQIRHLRACENDYYIHSKAGTATAVANGDFKGAVDDGGNSYTIEMKMSIATLAETSDWDGSNLRIELQTADNTTGAAGGRTQQMYWKDNTDNGWKDVNIYTPVVLAPGDAIKGNAVVKASAYVANNKIIVNNATGMVSVYDVAGKLIVTSAAHTIDVASLKAGLYIVKGNNFSTKVIKK